MKIGGANDHGSRPSPFNLSRAENTSALESPNFPLLLQPTPVPSGAYNLPEELANLWQRATGSWRLQQTLTGLKT